MDIQIKVDDLVQLNLQVELCILIYMHVHRYYGTHSHIPSHTAAIPLHSPTPGVEDS